MKPKTLFIPLFIICQTLAFGQKISKVDFDLVKSGIEEKNSKFHYPQLLERLRDLDTSLTVEDFHHLYYGSVFQENYNPYGTEESKKPFMENFKNKDYTSAISLGKAWLSENPVNLEAYHYLLLCYHRNQQKDSAQLIANIYFGFLKVLESSGDGKSIKSAYVVVRVSDEYQMLIDFGLSSISQSLIGTTDRLTIDQKGQEKGKKKIKELYFNVEKPFASLSKKFK